MHRREEGMHKEAHPRRQAIKARHQHFFDDVQVSQVDPEVEVECTHNAEDADAFADVMVSAYSMPKASVLRALPQSLLDTTGADVYISRFHGETVGSVALTYHGDTCGIWAMGTVAARQRSGIGRRLLSTAMVKARDSGSRRFFLGASPAGIRLYEGLGFKAVCSARVWVSGETH